MRIDIFLLESNFPESAENEVFITCKKNLTKMIKTAEKYHRTKCWTKNSPQSNEALWCYISPNSGFRPTPVLCWKTTYLQQYLNLEMFLCMKDD